MYCPECGKDLGNVGFCPDCEPKMSWTDRQKATWEISGGNSGNKEKENGLKDDILDFRAVTINGSVAVLFGIILYSFTPNYSFLIGALLGGFTTGILFKDKLTSRTCGISAFVGIIIALIIFSILISL